MPAVDMHSLMPTGHGRATHGMCRPPPSPLPPPPHTHTPRLPGRCTHLRRCAVCCTPQFACIANTAPSGGCIFAGGLTIALEFVGGADGSLSDLRSNTADAIKVAANSFVRCGSSGSPWTAPQSYNICGPACACNGAFVANTSTSCACPVRARGCPPTLHVTCGM
jgi:hypothetical protein